MEEREKLVGVLNDLIRINYDRTEGYQKAVEELKISDIDLKTLFTNMSTASIQFANELKTEVAKLGAEPAKDSTQSGKVYRVWKDIRATASARDRKSIIALCEFGEDAALRAYDAALKSDAEIPAEIRQIIVNQHANIKASHDVVKRYRDMHEAVESD